MSDDRLAFLLHTPQIVESAVRATLRAALEARHTYARPIEARDFANEALAQLDRTMRADVLQLDAVGRHELAAATVRAAMRFISSRLAHRLFAVDARQLCTAPRGADAAIRDGENALHLIRLESFASDARRVDCARDLVASAANEPSVRLPTVHFFSLRTSRFRSFATPHDAQRVHDRRRQNAA